MAGSKKFILTFMLSVFISLSYCVITMADTISIPDKVRIGLNYGGTAVESCNVSAGKGIQLGYMKNNSFNVLYEELSSNQITIKKDTNLHIQIGGNYNDYQSAVNQIKTINKKGIVAYPVFADSWQVWTGSYSDQNTAQSDVDKTIVKSLGKGNYKVIQSSDSRIICLNANGDIVLLFASDTSAFQVHPEAGNNPYAFKLNANSYRGDLEVRRFDGSDMTLINVVPLEQYLYGVVPCELEADSPAEALKAQAVAARTYTLDNLGKHSKLDFDLSNNTSDQVYKGLNNEDPNSNEAVDDTKGKKVVYNGNLAEVFYFASDGGKTEDSKNVFGQSIPYLKSVDDKYESGNSWHYTWNVTLTASKIKGILQNKGYDVGDVLSVQVTKVSDAGRAVELTIKGTTGEKVFENNACRTIFGLDSQMFTISNGGSGSGGSSNVNVKLADSVLSDLKLFGQKIMTSSGLKTLVGDITVVDAQGKKNIISSSTSRSGGDPDVYNISGKGWGHAVGMSQEGAKGMAKAGFTYDQILTYYFQGTKVE